MTFSRVVPCLCYPCRHCRNKGYSISPPSKSEVIVIQPISNQKINEDGKVENSEPRAKPGGGGPVDGSGQKPHDQNVTTQNPGPNPAEQNVANQNSDRIQADQSSPIENGGQKQGDTSEVGLKDDLDIPPPLPTTPPPLEDPLPPESPGGAAESEVLTVRDVDLCLTTNGEEHHTAYFEVMTRKTSPQLVVRRGQPYQLDLVLSRAYNPNRDGISFVFTLSGLFKF